MKLKLNPVVKKRAKTTIFWSGLGSATLIFVQSVALLFGFEIPTETSAQLIVAVNSFLGLLSLGGVLVDTKDVESFQAFKVKMLK